MALSALLRPCFLLLFAAGILLLSLSSAQRIRVRRQNMKVRINATGDTIVLKFLKPNPETKLEGYILGYGSSMFSKQFIQLPENGIPYETEIDAEPKYLVAVQPIPTNDVKKQCTGKVNLDKPLHLVIGSVTPTSVLLSWGTFVKTPYEGNIMNDCLEDGFYTIRYRERNRKWIYQTCPTSDTVIDNLKPNTAYEFGVRPNKDDRSGMWSKAIIHNTNMGDKSMQKPYKHSRTPKPVNPVLSGHRAFFNPRPAVHDKSNKSTDLHPLHTNPAFPGAPRTSFVNGEHHKGFSYPKPVVWSRNRMANNSLSEDVSPVAHSDTGRSRAPVVERFYGSPARPPFSPNKKTNIVGKPTGLDKTIDLRQAILKPKVPPVSAKPTKPKTTPSPLNATRFETWENSSVFSSIPASKVDAMGKERFIAPHVVYKTDKKPDEPCSITTSLSYFPEDEATETNVTGPPRTAPSNLTVVTVEGCPSFIILDWEKTDNETTEYEVISTTKGPDGEKVSILTTNQTHTAVENLKPESSYEFKVKPKNELGEGPPSEPVSFNTESADPRVSENVSGKDAIWTQFPFKTDSYSECNGKQYVKRTWYRKFVGIQLCNSLRYKIYLSDSLNGKFYNIGDQTGHGEDHCQFVDSFLDGRTGTQLPADQLPTRTGFYRAVRQEPVHFGQIGGNSHVTYVAWYECGTPIPGKW
ncbi:ABI family, member 3 (NESH) binding protein b isoform X10 [Pygocentrus nattereri]|uniref:ABI family, member 3 (NESH) binding protein b isoform X10 n=1 Tax=Pygocentrus nattereri TaxID=42514 RepID=UPI0008149F9B|nr:ABI family, member 3 (NESH) binding protein b isoform X10 [Pygocentrus nattereri]